MIKSKHDHVYLFEIGQPVVQSCCFMWCYGKIRSRSNSCYTSYSLLYHITWNKMLGYLYLEISNHGISAELILQRFSQVIKIILVQLQILIIAKWSIVKTRPFAWSKIVLELSFKDCKNHSGLLSQQLWL